MNAGRGTVFSTCGFHRPRGFACPHNLLCLNVTPLLAHRIQLLSGLSYPPCRPTDAFSAEPAARGFSG